LTSAARRRVFGDYQATQASRFVDEIPDALIDRVEPATPTWQHAGGPFRQPRTRERSAQDWTDDEPTYAYEDEDQSQLNVRPGLRVRHPQFGLGTVLSVEEQLDDLKITIRFSHVGQKKLLARFARLEPA
jgi:DNA helicase-2/ATP-dependent DNA helicase PcrA